MMQLKVYFILLLLLAQNAIWLTNSIALNLKHTKLIKNQINDNSKNKDNNNNNNNKIRKTLKKEKYHSQSFLEFSSNSKNKNKIKTSIPNFSFGSFDFIIAYQLLAEILKNGLLSDNGTTLAQECYRNIYHKQSQFFHVLQRFYSLMFGFYVSEKFLKNTESANENFLNAMTQIKKILEQVEDNSVILNNYRRSCFEAFKFVPNFKKDEVLKILNKPAYFGDISNTANAQPFIDSQFSIYRNHLPQSAFKNLNTESRGGINGSGSGLSGNSGYDGNFLKRLMVDARIKGLGVGFNVSEDERNFGGKGLFGSKKEYLYKPNITYDLGSKGGNGASKAVDVNFNVDKNIKDGQIADNNENSDKVSDNKNEDSNKKPSVDKIKNDNLKNNKFDKDSNSVLVPGIQAAEEKEQGENKSIDGSKSDPSNDINAEKDSANESKKNEVNDKKQDPNSPHKAENNENSSSSKTEIEKSENKTNKNKLETNTNNNNKTKQTEESNQNSNKNNTTNSSEGNENEIDDCIVESTDNTNATNKSKNDNNKKNRNSDYEFNLLVFGNFGEAEYFKDLSITANEELTAALQKENLSFDNKNNLCFINFQKEKIEINSTKGLNSFNRLLSSQKTIEKLNSANSLFLIGEITSTGIFKNEILDEIEKKQKTKLLDRIQCAWNLFLDSLAKTGFAQAEEDGSFLVSQEVDVLLGAPVFINGSTEKNLQLFDLIQKGKNMNEDNALIIKEDGKKGDDKAAIGKNSDVLFKSPKMTTLKFKDFYIQFLDFNSYLLVCLAQESEVEYVKCLKKNNFISDSSSASSDNNNSSNNKNNSNNKKSREDSENDNPDAESQSLSEAEHEKTQNDIDNKEKKIVNSNNFPNSENQEEFQSESESNRNSYNQINNNNKSNEAIFSFTNAKKYAWKLHNAILEKFLTQSAKYSVWKFMRAVHAPVSTFSGDSEFYFKMLKVLNDKGSEEAISLIDSMQQSNISLFIAAQAKAAQVLAYPYTRVFKKQDEKNCEKNINKNFVAAEKFGCAYTRHNKIFRENAVFFESEKCVLQQKNIQFDLPINFKATVKTQSVLYVFNVGNSGATLEKIHIGKASNGYLIWERSIETEKNASNGFANFAIGKDYVDVKFYELKGKNEVEKTAKFTVAEQIMPEQSIMNSVIDEKFCFGNTSQ